MRLALPLRCGAFLAALAVASPALANGRYPASGQIIVHPTDPNTVLVRATYGLLLTHQANKNWGWICEPAVGYAGVEDPAMGYMAGGTLLAGIFEGLAEGTPDGCMWSFVPELVNKYVIDVAVDKVDQTKGVVMISNGVGVDDAGSTTFLTQVWQTSDTGKTWTQAGVSLDPELLGLTVDTAPSNPMRVYISGRTGPPNYPGVIERSDDRGATWQVFPIPGADDTHLPYIGAVDPNDPDIVYVRIDSDPSDSLMVTKDGGMTWSTAFTASGKLNGFALSPDGSTVALGTPGVPQASGPNTDPGVWTAPTSTLQFTQQSKVGALCLTWSSSGLYACANEFVDKFTAGLSTDGGKTFQAIMHLAGICPLMCTEPKSPVTEQCPTYWDYTAETIGATCDLGLCGGGVGGGSVGGSGSGPQGTSATGSSSSGGGSKPVSKSCSCAIPGAAGGSLAGLGSLGLLALLWRRRRR
jgi:MYXO-CTERM domain-containing protein